MMAAAELARGSLEEAERQLALAIERSASVPADRRGRLEVVLTVLQLYLARQRGDLSAVAEAADRFLAAVDMPDEPQLSLGEDLRALTLISLGIVELWAFRFKDANQHLGQGGACTRTIERPDLELTALAHGAELAALRSYSRSTAKQAGDRPGPTARLERRAVRRRGLHGARRSDGLPGEAGGGGSAVARARRAHPTTSTSNQAVGMHLHYARGGLEMARRRWRGRDRRFLAAPGS